VGQINAQLALLGNSVLLPLPPLKFHVLMECFLPLDRPVAHSALQDGRVRLRMVSVIQNVLMVITLLAIKLTAPNVPQVTHAQALHRLFKSLVLQEHMLLLVALLALSVQLAELVLQLQRTLKMYAHQVPILLAVRRVVLHVLLVITAH